jgi:biopolymer transport protein ExbB/TolQ
MTDAVAVATITSAGTVAAGVIVALIQRLTKRVNGRMDEMEKMIKDAAYAKGHDQGVIDEHERVK